MMKYELGLEEPDPKRAGKSAFNIGTAYIVGGPHRRPAIFSRGHFNLPLCFWPDQE
jgi:hypothetical protein